MSIYTIVPIIHFIGLSLSVGAATVKLLLVFKCRSDSTFIPSFLKVSPLITRQIVTGMIILAISGIAWIVLGYDFSTLLIIKIALFGLIFILGPIIDNVVEPKLHKFAPGINEEPSPAFLRAQRQHLMLEVVATMLFYVIIILWVVQ